MNKGGRRKRQGKRDAPHSLYTLNRTNFSECRLELFFRYIASISRPFSQVAPGNSGANFLRRLTAKRDVAHKGMLATAVKEEP